MEERGGSHGPMLHSTDYLVVGANITNSWKHSTFGDKINKARSWQIAGLSKVKIVSEKHWVEALENPDADNDSGGPWKWDWGGDTKN